jgi:hypothetical protein
MKSSSILILLAEVCGHITLVPTKTQGVIQVPVIALFTKSDGLESKAFHDLRDEGLSRREAKDKLTKYTHNILTDSVMKPIMATRFPPSDLVILKGTLSITSCRRTDS